MNDATTIEDTPVQLVKKGVVKALLGTVQVGPDTLEGAGNNTRWVFDLDAVGGEDVTVKCIDYFGGREIEPDVMSFAIAPLSHSAYEAKPICVPDGASLTIKSLAAGGHFRVRVSIDIMHRQK